MKVLRWPQSSPVEPSSKEPAGSKVVGRQLPSVPRGRTLMTEHCMDSRASLRLPLLGHSWQPIFALKLHIDLAERISRMHFGLLILYQILLLSLSHFKGIRHAAQSEPFPHLPGTLFPLLFTGISSRNSLVCLTLWYLLFREPWVILICVIIIWAWKDTTCFLCVRARKGFTGKLGHSLCT